MKRNPYLAFFSSVAFFVVAAGSSVLAQNKDYPITGVPFTNVKMTDNFWLPGIKTNHQVTIPASFERSESTGRIKNFEMAAAKSGQPCVQFRIMRGLIGEGKMVTWVPQRITAIEIISNNLKQK